MLDRRFFRPVAGAGVVLAGLALSATIASAATTTQNFTVSANVVGVCTVTASALSFGTYTASSGAALDATTTVTPTCTNGLPYTVTMNGGNGSGATVANRLMTLSSSTLAYQLYTTNARTSIWGDGTSSTLSVGGTGSGAGQALTVYGRIPVGQYVTLGAYTDTIMVTVTY